MAEELLVVHDEDLVAMSGPGVPEVDLLDMSLDLFSHAFRCAPWIAAH
jgi:hypothetical protein